jgi:excisionase family DNA binding protein
MLICHGGTTMDGYMTTKDAAEKWGISIRQVQNHCKNGRINGVQRIGTNYLIPYDAAKPKYVYICETNEPDK